MPSLSILRKGENEGLCQVPTLASPSVIYLSIDYCGIWFSVFACFGASSYLFWTEWGQYPRIERSRLDGSERAILVNVSISWPNGISIDYEVHRNRSFFTFISLTCSTESGPNIT